MRLPLVAGVALISLAVVAFAACGPDDAKRPPLPAEASDDTSANGGSTGQYADVTLPQGGCYPTKAACGIVGSKCMAQVDYEGVPVKDLRFAQLRLTTPAALASPSIQLLVVGPAVTELSNKSCHLNSNMAGSFNWLMEFDTANKTLKTGGAPGDPAHPDPTQPYCFLSLDVSGTTIQAVTTAIEQDDSGAWSTTAPIDLNVPIFPGMGAPPIILPLKQTSLTNVVLSEQGNCIGRFRGEPGELDRADGCVPNSDDLTTDDAYLYESGGQLAGYVTLEDADKVEIAALSSSLCKFLIGATNDGPNCPRNPDGSIALPATGGPDLDSDGDGTNDAYTLQATFAASSVPVSGDCAP